MVTDGKENTVRLQERDAGNERVELPGVDASAALDIPNSHGMVPRASGEAPNMWGFDVVWANRLLPLCYLYSRREATDPVPTVQWSPGWALDLGVLSQALGYMPAPDLDRVSRRAPVTRAPEP